MLLQIQKLRENNNYINNLNLESLDLDDLTDAFLSLIEWYVGYDIEEDFIKEVKSNYEKLYYIKKADRQDKAILKTLKSFIHNNFLRESELIDAIEDYSKSNFNIPYCTRILKTLVNFPSTEKEINEASTLRNGVKVAKPKAVTISDINTEIESRFLGIEKTDNDGQTYWVVDNSKAVLTIVYDEWREKNEPLYKISIMRKAKIVSAWEGVYLDDFRKDLIEATVDWDNIPMLNNLTDLMKNHIEELVEADIELGTVFGDMVEATHWFELGNENIIPKDLAEEAATYYFEVFDNKKIKESEVPNQIYRFEDIQDTLSNINTAFPENTLDLRTQGLINDLLKNFKLNTCSVTNPQDIKFVIDSVDRIADSLFEEGYEDFANELWDSIADLRQNQYLITENKKVNQNK